MDELHIRWTGGSAEFQPGTTVRIGRDPGADIQPQNTNVSRQHAEVSHGLSGWVLRDVGSAQGTWRDGRQVESVDVRGTVRVTLGREGRGEVITLEAAAVPRGGPAATEIAGVGGAGGHTQVVDRPGSGEPATGDGTVVVGQPPHRPGGALQAKAVAGATVVTGDSLNLECAGQSFSFLPGRPVTIGRDQSCDVVSSNPTVSRQHATLFHDGTGWVLRDDGSSGGTYVGGKRIGEHRLAGSTAVWLGDANTGERLVVVASGTSTAGKPSSGRRWPLLLGVGVAVLALIVVAGLLVGRTLGGGSARSDDDLGRATVRLAAGDLSGTGTVVDADQGLILTNAHVVAPDAVGTGVRDALLERQLLRSADDVLVLVAPALGQAAEPAYVAEVVAVDAYLDLAVIQITETIGGRFIRPGSDDLASLVDVPIGDSSQMRSGDEIRVFGYPSAAQTPSVTVTEGIVSGPVTDRRMGENEAMLNITANISPGNSGGLAVNDEGELIGIPTLIRDDAVPSMRPSRFAIDLIEAARSGEEYESQYITPLTSEEVSNVGLVAPDVREGIVFDCETGAHDVSNAARFGAVGVAFDFEGFESGRHQDMIVLVYADNGGQVDLIGLTELHSSYPVRWEESGCATITIPIDTTDVGDGTIIRYAVGLGPNYENVTNS